MTITRDTSITFPAKYTYRAAQGGPSVGPGDNSDVVSQLIKIRRTRTGTRLPKWRQVIASGENATTPLTAEWEEAFSTPVDVVFNLTYPDGSWAIREFHGDAAFGVNGVAMHGSYPSSPCCNLEISDATADNRARARFYKKLREAQVAFSGPTFLGELRETLRMIKRPAQAIRDSCDRYYHSLAKWRGRNRPPAPSKSQWKWRTELEKVAGGLWLENSFGWQPLLNDVKNAWDAYERLTNTHNRRVISVGDTDSKDIRQYLVDQGGGRQNANRSGVVFDDNIARALSSVSVRYKGSVSSSTEADQWSNLALFGFTPSEFVPTAWELLPWSFLIDYFTNVGDVLSSSVTRATNVNFVCRTVRREIKFNGSFVPDAEKTRTSLGSSWSITGGGNVGTYHTKRTTVSRAAGSYVPLPVLQFESGLNVGQMTNITALLTNFLSVHNQSKPRLAYRR